MGGTEIRFLAGDTEGFQETSVSTGPYCRDCMVLWEHLGDNWCKALLCIEAGSSLPLFVAPLVFHLYRTILLFAS